MRDHLHTIWGEFVVRRLKFTPIFGDRDMRRMAVSPGLAHASDIVELLLAGGGLFQRIGEVWVVTESWGFTLSPQVEKGRGGILLYPLTGWG